MTAAPLDSTPVMVSRQIGSRTNDSPESGSRYFVYRSMVRDENGEIKADS